MAKTVKRLYHEFQPRHYTIELESDPKALKFRGSVIIAGHKVGRPSQRLTLHQGGLKLSQAHVIRHDKKGDQQIPIDRINHHNSYQEVRLHATQMLYPGQYTISLGFRGTITRPMNGIYPAVFKDKGKEKRLIATQFESHHAREAFPCVDEPEAKATFDLTLITPPGETVVSNTPIREQRAEVKGERKNNKKVGSALAPHNSALVTVFETTPRMPTYLLAFVHGNLKYKEAKTKTGVVVRAYATPNNVNFTDFALDFAVKCLEFYNDYFGIDYPLPKCDLITLPDFAAGAMENWGCITFREQALLVDPKNTSLRNKQFVAMVVAHELAHQWFGNLVTMRWWTDLWLNEGFASWIEFLAVDHIFPAWQMWTQFIVDEQQQAFKLDSLEHSHPIEVPVRHPDEIRTIFDAISYSKGASVIHMLHQYLGATAFRDGLRYYLQKHAYNNTDTVDLWAALEEISKKPVKDFMHAWTSQSGFPIVQVDVNSRSVKLGQQQFYINPAARKTEAVQIHWPVALLAGDKLPDLFETGQLSVGLNNPENLKLNRGQSGFYRVIYNTTHLRRLGQMVQRGRLDPLDRLGILSDSFEAAKAGLYDTIEALSLLDYYHQEDNATVWDVIAANLASIRLVMDDETLREMMKPFVRQLVSGQLKRLGWRPSQKESHFDSLLRPIILGMAAIADEPSVVKEALRLFKAMRQPTDIRADLRAATASSSQLRRGVEINPDLRGVVYTTAVRHGDQAVFNKLLAMHRRTSSSEEQTTIAAALTSFKQPDLINQALKLITADEVRLQDVGTWVAYGFMNRHAKRLTWQWLKDKWPWFEKNLQTDLTFSRYPIFAARAFSDLEFLKDFKDFFYGVRTPSLDRSIKQGIEIIEWQSAWKKRDFKEISAFFKAKSKPNR